MDLSKHREFFNPDELTEDIHIIGCGAVGSTIAEQLARLGIKKLHLYDFDTVSEHNITNQMFLTKQIGMLKVQALTHILTDINPEIEIETHYAGWTPETYLSGYVFIAVDSIDTRKEIVKSMFFNNYVKAVFDVRMRLTDAQHFACIWQGDAKTTFKNTMNFTHEEAQATTPVSACGTTLNVTPTVRVICSYAVANFINVVLGKEITTLILSAPFDMHLDAYNAKGLIE